MIQLRHVYKYYPTRDGMVQILEDVNLEMHKGERVGILGRNGAGKSTLVRLISGAERPSRGHINRRMSVSWPLAFGGAFQSALTGMDNLRFICRIYGTTSDDKVEAVQEFSELGKYLFEPVRTYSAGMRARLAFALSMTIEFDCFLIDEIIAVGDVRFQRKCHVELFERRADRAMIIVSHDAGFIREHCHRAGLLMEGKFLEFDNVDDGFAAYNSQYS